MLLRRRSSLILLTATAFLLADAVLVVVVAATDFGFDFACCYQQGAARALDDPSSLYAWSDSYTFRYTPLGALLFAPLVPLSEQAATWAWLTVKLAVLAGVAAWFSAAWDGRTRWLVALGVVAFPPVVHDLVLGNVSTITLFVFLALARWGDWRGGVAIGALTVLMPKPHLVPVLAYLAIRRPRQFGWAAATGVAGLLIGVAVFGTGPWLAFFETLREPLGRTFTANIGFSGLLGPAGVVVGALIAGVILVVGVLVGGRRGFGLSIVAGIAAGPYTFIHYLAGTLVAAESVIRSKPRWLAPFPWLLVVFPLIPVWLAALAAVIRGAPEEPPAAAEQPAAGRG